MRNLLLSSLILLLFSSCHFGHYGRLKKTDGLESHYPKALFGDNFNSFLFKTNITVYGKDYSGLLVTKQMSPNDYRVIFTTELGMKLFDFEFKDTAFTLHYCVPQFNKPKLLKVIQHDIETLIMNDIRSGAPAEYYIQDDYKILRLQFDKFYKYYFTEKNSEHLVKIEHAKKRRKKTTFTLSNYENNFPGKIVIQHHDIKLKIELNLLKK